MPIKFKALKPKESDFEPQTIGEHIKKRRLLLGLTQKSEAKMLKVTQFSIINGATSEATFNHQGRPRFSALSTS